MNTHTHIRSLLLGSIMIDNNERKNQNEETPQTLINVMPGGRSRPRAATPYRASETRACSLRRRRTGTAGAVVPESLAVRRW